MKKIFKIGSVFLAVFIFTTFFTTPVSADVDTTPPVITLVGSASITLTIGDPYTDTGATALDDTDGDITAIITVVNPVNTTVAGTYTVSYDVQDLASNIATTVTRTVIVNPVQNVTFVIRDGNTVLFNGQVPLPASGTVSINDSSSIAHTVDARSVLAILKSIDDTNNDFNISNLQYFSSFSSLYLKCILPTGSTELCDNWQYAVGNFTPYSSIDTTMLTGGETVGIYFGTSRRVSLSSSSITTGGSLTATAELYDYQTNVWNPLTGVNIGVTLPNLSDPWNPTVVSTHPVDALGVANISITGTNIYTLGIVEDFYFPSYTVTVTDAPSGGGGSGPTQTFSVPNAISYLKSVQNSDGSFTSNSLYTDWAAIAYSAGSVTDNSKTTLLAYLNSNNTLSSILTDNERRAMSLLALGQNPYSFGGVNYIRSIIDRFDGTQFGDTSLITDDIFALIPLASSGYESGDDIMAKDIAYIISKQKSNGSWEDSVDVTAAAIQALKLFNSVDGVNNSLTQASSYLQNMQQNDGGWGNTYSTSWALQASLALGTSWTKGGKTALDYLTTTQLSDGGLLPANETLQNRIWATSYAVPAVLGKTWSTIMQSVSKEKIETTLDTEGVNKIEDKKIETENKKEEVPVTTENVVVPENKGKKVVTQNNTVQNNEEEQNEAVIPNPTLTASASDSKTKIPTPYIFGGIAGVLGVGIFIRWFKFIK